MSASAGLPFLANKKAESPKALLQRAQNAEPARVVIAQAAAALPLKAAKAALEARVATPLFTGARAAIEAEANTFGWSVANLEVVDADGEAGCARAAFIAVREGRADAVMKGHLHTDILMKAALDREHGVRIGRRFVHVFHMTAPGSDQALLLSDCAVNVNPNLETHKDSLRAMVTVAKAIGIAKPKLALLCATETPIKSVPSSMAAQALKEWAVKGLPEAIVGGPYALDGVLSAEAAAIKGLGDAPCAGGRADGILAPSLDAGNALFKAFVYLSGACAAGVVMGGAVPVLLTSRADSPESRLASFALASILARTEAGHR